MTTISRQQKEPPSESSWAVRLNRWTLSMSRHYLQILLTFLGIFISLPIAAPILMHIGLTGPAHAIYTIYSPLCHQFAYRSWFLFGEQNAYPRASLNFPGLKPYESYLPEVYATLGDRRDTSTLSFEYDAKNFLGNEQLGYKVAVCQRDVGIYWALFIGGLIFSIPAVRRHLRPAPILLYGLLGLGPIGLDGFSQLLSYPPFGLWPVRESTPLFRLITGGLFGLMNAWLAYPYLEASARETIREIEAKFARRRQRLAEKGLEKQVNEGR